MNPKAFVQTMIALASASLGLVAALAWNEAIKGALALLGLGDRENFISGFNLSTAMQN